MTTVLIRAMQGGADASTTIAGIVELATSDETISGASSTLAVTPAGLKYTIDQRVQQFYGVAWDESADTYARTGSTAGQATEVTLVDAFLPIQRMMRRCVLADDGTVAYYLHATDSTKKEDGVTASVLDGTEGQVMVEIPKFWYRHTYVGTTHTWDVSPVPLAGFSVHPAFLSGTTELDYVYYGAYEANLYDVSASVYNGQCYQTAVSAVFASADNSITIATRTGWATGLKVGQKMLVTGTASNNITITVASIISATAITTSESLTDETAASTVIQAQMDVTATTGDKLSSVSGVLPVTGSTYGTRAHFRTLAGNRGTGWSQALWDVHSAIQLLYLTEYADWYSQSVLGYGIAAVSGWAAYNDYNPIAKTGNSNSIGNASGCTATSAITTGLAAKDVYLSYRGIENFYGHLWKFVDGINTNNNRSYVCNVLANLADDTTTNYTDVGASNSASNGYQGALLDIDRGFLPKDVTGSSSTKITDYYYQSSGWRVAFSGGAADVGVSDGAACLALYYASGILIRYVGARLVFRK